jgi:UDP-N-acetylglucosamine--N-acetylmuramyl-(pentapeptide) pyrophosphoryl-undecaprenol N-acetylglucosamine transferase
MSRLFIFAGGGTGGHIFPALAIHEQLQELSGESHSLFVCSERPLDAKILEKEGVPYRSVPAKPLVLRPRSLVRFVRCWGPSLRAGRGIIREARREHGEVHVVAMGGFVAAPLARAAVVEKASLMLVNMDAVPGKANRWIARMADRIVTSAEVVGSSALRAECGSPESGRKGTTDARQGVPRYPRCVAVPPIVRQSAIAGRPAAECRKELGLDPERATLLVTGASQGARSINRLLIRLLEERPGLLERWQVIHQTGAGEDEEVRAAYSAAGVRAVVQPFFEGMGLAWGAADLAVSRAGAGSVAEAWANHTPTLFLPYPYHRDQHQRYNARPLEAAGGAVIATDHIDEGVNSGAGGPGPILGDLIADESRWKLMRTSLERLGPADGAARIARMLLAG